MEIHRQQTHCVNVYLSKTLYLLLDTGSTQEDRKSSQHDLKIVDKGRKASITDYVYVDCP